MRTADALFGVVWVFAVRDMKLFRHENPHKESLVERVIGRNHSLGDNLSSLTPKAAVSHYWVCIQWERLLLCFRGGFPHQQENMMQVKRIEGFSTSGRLIDHAAFGQRETFVCLYITFLAHYSEPFIVSRLAIFTLRMNGHGEDIGVG